MAVKYRGFTNGKKASATTIPITLPALTAAEDYAVICATSNSTATTWSTPAGWALLAESTLSTEEGGKRSLAIFVRKLTGATGTNLPTLESSASATLEYSVMVAEAGSYDTTTPVDAHSPGWQKSPASDPIEVTLSGGTASIAGDLVFLFLAEAQVPLSAPSGFTKDVEGTNTTLYHKLGAASGAVNIVVTKNSKVAYNAYAVAIKASAEEVVGTMAGAAKCKFGTAATPAAQAGVAGKAATRFSQSGSVKAEGGLTGVARARFAASAAPAARAALAGATSARFSASASMAASAAISGAAQTRFASTANLRAIAGLAGATHARFLTSAHLVGETEQQGTMAGSAACRFICTATLRARAALAGQSRVNFNATGAPAARARLTGEATVRFAAQGALAASAGLGGQAAVRFSSHGALAAAARLAGKAQFITRTSGTLAAQARISASSHARFLVSGSISGRGTVPSAVYVTLSSGSHPAAVVQEGTPAIVSIESGQPVYATVEEIIG